ncbi:MAG: hypothetical protein ACT4ON_16200 [Bacteroidota bacterium]
MKTYFILFLVAIGVNSELFSQSGEGCFDENTRIINLGIGFGGGRYYKSAKKGHGYSYKTTPAFSLSYEQAWKPKLGPGYLGIGAYMGYQNASYRYDYSYSNYNGNSNYGNFYYRHHWNYFMFAARAAYHWDKLNSENAEVYGGVILGARIQTYSYTTNDPSPNNYKLNDNSFYPAASLLVGARWYFVPKVAAFIEAGYGISYITGGISFKF